MVVPGEAASLFLPLQFYVIFKVFYAGVEEYFCGKRRGGSLLLDRRRRKKKSG